MLIKKKNIRNAWKATSGIKENEKFVIAIKNHERFKRQLDSIGFTKKLEVGEKILPAVVGNTSKLNAEGLYKPIKDLPMETAFRQIQWTWEQWAGKGQTDTVTEIREVPYQRYQRLFIEPTGEEMMVQEKDGCKYITSRVFTKNKNEEEAFKVVINLFLEVFQECIILSSDLAPPISPTIKRLNWSILPKGKYPWEKVKEKVQDTIKKQPKGNQPVIQYHLESITAYEPEFVAIGNGGFSGYFVFGFPKRNLYILESVYTGNATYIFSQNWKILSQMTKAEILAGNLQKDRFIHRNGWYNNIKTLFN